MTHDIPSDESGRESPRQEDLREMLESCDQPGMKELMEVYGSGEEYERRKNQYLHSQQNLGSARLLD